MLSSKIIYSKPQISKYLFKSSRIKYIGWVQLVVCHQLILLLTNSLLSATDLYYCYQIFIIIKSLKYIEWNQLVVCYQLILLLTSIGYKIFMNILTGFSWLFVPNWYLNYQIFLIIKRLNIYSIAFVGFCRQLKVLLLKKWRSNNSQKTLVFVYARNN